MKDVTALMPIEFCAVRLDDIDALLEFELKNRTFFERLIPARPANFYSAVNIRRHVEEAIQQRALGIAHQFLIKSSQTIVGRANLTGIHRALYNKGTIGYRIGEHASGQGIATRAVNFLTEEAFERLGLWRIEAQVRADHLASVRVLEKNQFTVYGQSRQSLYLHGTWTDLLYFERRNNKQVNMIGV